MGEEARREPDLIERGTQKAGSTLFTANFVLLCLSSFFFLGSAHMTIPAIPVYITSLGGSQADVGLVMGAFSLSSIIARPFVGRLVDKGGHGARILLLGAANFMVSALAYIFATSMGPLVLLRLFHGLGMANFSTASGSIVAEIAPRHRRGEAAGYYGLASNVAMAVAPALGALILAATNFTGFFVAAALTAVMSLILASRIKLEKTTESSSVSPGSLICQSAIRPSLVLITMCFAFGTAITFVPVYAHDRGIANVGLFFTAYAAASVVFRSLAGYAADKWGRQVVVLPGTIGLAMGVSSLALGPDMWGMIAAGWVMGMGFGTAYPGLMALVIDGAAPQERGSASATYFGAFDLGVGLGAAVAGLLGELGGFSAMFLGAGLVVMLGFSYFLSGLRRKASVMT